MGKHAPHNRELVVDDSGVPVPQLDGEEQVGTVRPVSGKGDTVVVAPGHSVLGKGKLYTAGQTVPKEAFGGLADARRLVRKGVLLSR